MEDGDVIEVLLEREWRTHGDDGGHDGGRGTVWASKFKFSAPQPLLFPPPPVPGRVCHWTVTIADEDNRGRRLLLDTHSCQHCVSAGAIPILHAQPLFPSLPWGRS